LQVLAAAVEADFVGVFSKLAQQRDAALVVASDAYFSGRRSLLVALAMRHGVPTIYERRDSISPMSAGSSATVTTEPTPIASSESIQGGFSRVPGQRTCRCCSRRNSSW
jgi:hypothetical protein